MSFLALIPINAHNAWLILIFAIICSAVGTTSLKFLAKTGRYYYLIGVFSGYALFLILITLVLKWIDMGVGYAVWAGLSTLLMTLSGVIFFHDSLSVKKIFSLTLIVIGVIILSYTSSF